MSGHTAGPWKLDGSRRVLGKAFDDSYKSIVDQVRGGSPETADANARLIAAAPDLFEACNGLLGLLQLIQARLDVSPSLSNVLLTNHRVVAAHAAVARVGSSLGEDKRVFTMREWERDNQP